MRSLLAGLIAALSLPALGAPLFPDVPERHWARDQVAALAARGLVEGYPDGTFKGDRVASRWELALLVARLLARLEQERDALAPRQELVRLAEGLAPELSALGVRLENLEEGSTRLDRRVAELERISFYGNLQTVAVAQHFSNQGAIQSPPYLQAGGGPAAQARPQTQGVLPVVDYVRGRALTSGAGFTTRALLGLELRLSDEVEARAEFSAYSSQGDHDIDTYWGATPPNSIAQVTGTANDPHFPFTRMGLERVQLDHKPSRTRVVLGTFDTVRIDPLIYTGQPNLSIFPPGRYAGYGIQAQGATGEEKEDRLLWEAFASRWGEGNAYQGQDYRHLALGADAAYEFHQGAGRLQLNFARLSDQAPDASALVAGLDAGTNVAYGASRGWTPVQWVNPPGFFAAERPGPEQPAGPFVPNVVDTRPIPGWNAFRDDAAGLTAGGGNYGPAGQQTFGLSARYNFDFGLRVLGELAHSDFHSNRNSPYSAPGTAWRVQLAGQLGAFDLDADYLRVDPTYNPDLFPNAALGRRAPITMQLGGRFFLHDNALYPHNRTGFRARVRHQFDPQGSWFLNANFLRQTRTSLYDVRSPANSLGPANPTGDVIGYRPGYIDSLFAGYAHPNLYGPDSVNAFTAGLEPLEDPRGYETLLGAGLDYGPLSLSYENRHFARPTTLPAALGGSQNYLNVHTQFLSAQTRWDLRHDLALRAGLDYVRVRGHLDPAGLYNFYALSNNSVAFTNLDSTQVIPGLGLELQLSEKVRWNLSGRYYLTRDHVSTALSTGSLGHPFDWSGPQILSEFKLEF